MIKATFKELLEYVWILLSFALENSTTSNPIVLKILPYKRFTIQWHATMNTMLSIMLLSSASIFSEPLLKLTMSQDYGPIQTQT